MRNTIAALLFLYAFLTHKRRRYIATWYERRNDGPWQYKQTQTNERSHPWQGTIAISELLPEYGKVEVMECKLERRRGL